MNNPKFLPQSFVNIDAEIQAVSEIQWKKPLMKERGISTLNAFKCLTQFCILTNTNIEDLCPETILELLKTLDNPLYPTD